MVPLDERRWEQYGAGAGILFVVLVLLSAFIAPQPPHIDASAAKIARYFGDHRRALMTSAMLGTLGSIALVWFAAHLRHVLQRAEDGREVLAPVVFGAGVAAAGIGVLYAIPAGAMALMVKSPEGLANASTVRAMFDMMNIVGAALMLAAALFVGATSWAMARHEAVVEWLGWVGFVIAAAFAVVGVAGFYVTTYSSFWMALGLGSFVAFLLWTLVLSVAMLQRPEVSRAATRQAVLAS